MVEDHKLTLDGNTIVLTGNIEFEASSKSVQLRGKLPTNKRGYVRYTTDTPLPQDIEVQDIELISASKLIIELPTKTILFTDPELVIEN